MSEESLITIGTREQWGQERPFGISTEDLRQHLYIVGKSGTGKTTLLKNLILQLISQGHGVGVIDPHGDLAQDILDHIPRSRIEETVYFNPADLDFPIGMNVLRTSAPRHLVASGIVSALRSIWHSSWGPRLEYILYAAIAALLECENVSLLGLQRILSDPEYRRWVVSQVTDPMVRTFWLHEFGNYDKRFVQEAIAPIQNKVGQLLMSSVTRNILGQVRSTIDARFMMDDGRIFVANLSKGKLGRIRRTCWERFSSPSFSSRPCRGPTYRKMSDRNSSSLWTSSNRLAQTHSPQSFRRHESTASPSSYPTNTRSSSPRRFEAPSLAMPDPCCRFGSVRRTRNTWSGSLATALQRGNLPGLGTTKCSPGSLPLGGRKILSSGRQILRPVAE